MDSRAKSGRMIVTIHQPNYLPYLGFFHKMANADVNEALIGLVARWLSIRTKIVHASELPAPQTDDATAKNIHMVRSLGGDTYLSGQGGHDYLDESQFTDVRLVYDAFTPTPYPQLFGEFIPNLAAIDAVFNCGESIKLRKMFVDASG